MGKKRGASWQLQHEALKSVHAAMAHMLQEGTHADVRLESQGEVTLAHGSVLASMSPIFKAMLARHSHHHKQQVEDGPHVITLKVDCISTTTALRGFLRLVYIGEFDYGSMTWEHTLEVLAASHRYEVPAVKAICVRALRDMLTCSNCLRVLEYADMYDPGLRRHCRRFVGKHFKEVVLTGAFEDLATRKPTVLVDLVRAKTESSALGKVRKAFDKTIRCANGCHLK